MDFTTEDTGVTCFNSHQAHPTHDGSEENQRPEAINAAPADAFQVSDTETDAANQLASSLPEDDAPGRACLSTALIPHPAYQRSHTTPYDVPRIRVHASCRHTKTADSISRAIADPAMKHVHGSVETGGLDAAIVRFALSPSPDLLLVEAENDAAQLLEGVRRLVGVLDRNTRLVVLGPTNDVRLYQRLMALGVAEYILTPARAHDIINVICDVYAREDRCSFGRTIAVIGARGGLGASAIAHNLAWTIVERQDTCATLLDLDLHFGTAALDFDRTSHPAIRDLLDHTIMGGSQNLTRSGVVSEDRLQIIAASATLDRQAAPQASEFAPLIEMLKQSTPFVVLDIPHVWTKSIKQCLLSADHVVIAAAPDLACLRDVENMVKALRRDRGPQWAPHVVLSMVGVPHKPELTIKDFTSALGVTPAASFAFDPAVFVGAALNNEMIGQFAPDSSAARTFEALAAELTGRKIKPREPRKDVALLSRNRQIAGPGSAVRSALRRLRRSKQAPHAFEATLAAWIARLASRFGPKSGAERPVLLALPSPSAAPALEPCTDLSPSQCAPSDPEPASLSAGNEPELAEIAADDERPCVDVDDSNPRFDAHIAEPIALNVGAFDDTEEHAPLPERYLSAPKAAPEAELHGVNDGEEADTQAYAAGEQDLELRRARLRLLEQLHLCDFSAAAIRADAA